MLWLYVFIGSLEVFPVARGYGGRLTQFIVVENVFSGVSFGFTWAPVQCRVDR